MNFDYGQGQRQQRQGQGQLSKQQQISDQALSYSTTGTVLSALESYANHFGCNSHIFNAYDNFNCGTTKRPEQLKDQIIAQLDVLNASHSIYRKQYGGYQFPQNMTQDQMIDKINQWKVRVPPQDKVYYDTAIKILKGQQVQSFSNQLGNDSRVNPAYLAESTGVIYESHQIGKKAVDDYYQKGINPQMKLNYQQHGDSNINRAGQRELNRQQLNTALDTKFDHVLSAVRGIVNNYNASKYISNYNRDEQAFIMEYEKHVQQYQLYWYRNSKAEHQKIMNELYNLVNQATPKAGNIFNRLWNTLNGGFA